MDNEWKCYYASETELTEIQVEERLKKYYLPFVTLLLFCCHYIVNYSAWYLYIYSFIDYCIDLYMQFCILHN